MSSLASIAGLPVKTPIEQARRGFVVGVPSLGLVPTDLAFSFCQATYPINFGPLYLTQNGWRWNWEKSIAEPVGGETRLPVADARNVIAWLALQNKAEWLFFRDDDTIAPPEAPNRIFTIARDALDKNIPLICVGGNYMSKQFPPHSLILVDGISGGFENWRMGDLVEVANEKRAGGIGMGCTLIHMSVIEKMEPPWFKTVLSLDPKSQHFDHMAGCMIHDGNDIQDVAPGGARMTEDIYFCRKARRYGFTHVYCDTTIQCQHVDITTGRRYFFNPVLQRGVMTHGNVMAWLPRPGDPIPISGRPHPVLDAEGSKLPADWKRPEVVRFDLGQPGKKEGFITIDLFDPSADERDDIHNLQGLVEKYGLADEIRASHILEHFGMNETIGMLREWARALKSGGVINIEVPDAEWGCENLLKHKDLPADQYCGELYKLIGLQTNPGDFHKCLFTKSYLEGCLNAIPELEGVHVEFHSYPDPKVQRAIRATAKRREGAVLLRHDSDIHRAILPAPTPQAALIGGVNGGGEGNGNGGVAPAAKAPVPAPEGLVAENRIAAALPVA